MHNCIFGHLRRQRLILTNLLGLVPIWTSCQPKMTPQDAELPKSIPIYEGNNLETWEILYVFTICSHDYLWHWRWKVMWIHHSIKCVWKIKAFQYPMPRLWVNPCCQKHHSTFKKLQEMWTVIATKKIIAMIVVFTLWDKSDTKKYLSSWLGKCNWYKDYESKFRYKVSFNIWKE